MPLNIAFFEASKSVSTKTLLLKHYYRRQGKKGRAKGSENLEGGALSGPVRDTPPYRAIPFRDSIAEGVSNPCALFS